MFCKATLVTIALALMASAGPIIVPNESSARDGGVMGIALNKRGSLTNMDGTFNADAVTNHLVRQKDVDDQTFSKGASTNVLATVPGLGSTKREGGSADWRREAEAPNVGLTKREGGSADWRREAGAPDLGSTKREGGSADWRREAEAPGLGSTKREGGSADWRREAEAPGLGSTKREGGSADWRREAEA